MLSQTPGRAINSKDRQPVLRKDCVQLGHSFYEASAALEMRTRLMRDKPSAGQWMLPPDRLSLVVFSRHCFRFVSREAPQSGRNRA